MTSKPLTVGSLFAGIGGFDLAAERAGLEVRWQVEIDPFCRRVLEKHWPHVRRYEDVRNLVGFQREEFGYIGAHAARFCLEPVDIMCGGFPCQDVSLAGPGLGLAGERSGLWFEFHRLIRDLRPRYIVVENVAGLLVRGMDRVLGDLAESGHDAEWCSFPTGRSMGHERERVFIVAYPVRSGLSERIDSDANRAHAPRIFTRERFASVLEGCDPAQKWADRPLLGRGVPRIPKRMDRVKSLGNTVIPDPIERIFRWIVEAEKELSLALEQRPA